MRSSLVLVSLVLSLAPACGPVEGAAPGDSAPTLDPFEGTVPEPLPGDGSVTLEGDVDCENPVTLTFEARASEIIELRNTFTYVGPEGGRGLPFLALEFGGEPVFQGVVAVATGEDSPWRVNLLESGTYELHYTADPLGCGPLHFETTLTRVRVPSTNLDADHATPLADGEATAGTLGCNGDQRWYALDLDANQTVRVDLGAVSLVEREDGSFAGAALVGEVFDADGEPVIVSGLGWLVAMDGTGIPTENSRELTVPERGTYFLRTQLYTGCSIFDTWVRYHTP